MFGCCVFLVGVGRDGMNNLVGTDTPWNDLAATYAPWMKWFLILAAVSSMFVVMINSNNGIVRIVHTMGRDELLPRALGKINAKRQTPGVAVIWQALFVLV